MTLPAVDTWDVRGVPGPKYQVGPKCSNPHCRRWADDPHHIVRRSKIGGDWAWIDVQGETLPNLCGLCRPCHDDITGRVGGHKAAIRLTAGRWHWCLGSGDELSAYRNVGELDPHPPTLDVAERALVHPVSGLETCPTCGAVKRRRPSSTRGPGRRRKTWTVPVPDGDEDGAAILDTLVDDLALVLGYGQDAGARYYVLVPTLTYAQMERQRFVDQFKGVGE